ncbi:MAG: hypothetical protein PPP56_07405 [Longimonas sp.]|uniref:hypothetical protein n=1 Tax=Longimonas sp. TaxID=2039626 RepID=UPI00334C4B8F
MGHLSSEAYWKAVHAHIDALLDLPIEEHDAYLEVHCSDMAMRRDVKSWLGYIYSPSNVLDESVVTYAQALLADHRPPRRPPLWSDPPTMHESDPENNGSSQEKSSQGSPPGQRSEQPGPFLQDELEQPRPRSATESEPGRKGEPVAEEEKTGVSSKRPGWMLWAVSVISIIGVLFWWYTQG